MKRFLFFLAILFCCATGFGQAPPILRTLLTTNTFGPTTNVVVLASPGIVLGLTTGSTNAVFGRFGTAFDFRSMGTNTSFIGGSGTPNTVPLWTGANTLGDSGITNDVASDIIGIGATSLSATGITNSTDIFAYGVGALANAAITDNSDIYAFGSGAMDSVIMESGGARHIYAIGNDAVQQATFVNTSRNIYGLGPLSLRSAVLDGTTFVFALGVDSLDTLQATNSSQIYTFGENLINDNSVILDSSEIFAFGYSGMDEVAINSGVFVFAYGNAPMGAIQAESIEDFYAYGTAPLDSSFATNSTMVFAYGNFPLSGATILDSTVIYAYGDNALASTVITNNSSEIYGFGEQAISGSTISDSAGLYAVGNSLGGASVTGSGNVFGIGANALLGATLVDSSDIYGFGSSTLSAANLTNSTSVYAIGDSAGVGLVGTHNNTIILGAVAPTEGTANDAVILGTSMALQLSGNTNRYTDDGSTLLRNGVPISGSGETTATNIVTLTQTGTNVSQLDFSLVARGGAFKLTATNNCFVGTPTGVASSPFTKAWMFFQQPSTGTCTLTFTNGSFASPEGLALAVDTNNGSVAVLEFVSDPFTNGLVHISLTPLSKRVP